MYDGPYHTYLEILSEKEHKLSFFGKLMLSALAIFLTFASFLSAFSIYKYKQEAPLRNKYTYLVSAQKGVLATSSSLDEIVTTFNVQGEKTVAIDNLKNENNTSDGYLIYLSQLQKNKTKIESISQNIKFQKDQITSGGTIEEQLDLKNQLISYYDASTESLEKLKADHQFFISIHMGLGPSLYLPVLSEDSVWQTQNKEEIKNYYNKMRDEAGLALENLSKIDAQGDYKAYLDSQLKYLEALVNLSGAVTAVLDGQTKSIDDEKQHIEAAYDLSIKSKNGLEATSGQILNEKLRLTDAANNIAQLVSVRFLENTVNNSITNSLNGLSYTNSLSKRVETVLESLEKLSPLQKYLKL